MSAIISAILASTAGSTQAGSSWIYPAQGVFSTGSIQFNRPNLFDYGRLVYEANEDWNFGEDDFTIEWYQFMAEETQYPRIFSLGTIDGEIHLALSIEQLSPVLWIENQPYFASMYTNSPPIVGFWRHFAIVREGDIVSLYYQGARVLSVQYQGSIGSSTDELCIGTKISGQSLETQKQESFHGYLAGFRWSKAAARYFGENIVPTPLPHASDANDILILNAQTQETYLTSAAVPLLPFIFQGTEWAPFGPTNAP
jgi:hypothetical protein